MKGGYPMRTSSLRSGFLMSTSITGSCGQKFVGTMCSSSNLGDSSLSSSIKCITGTEAGI